MEGFMRMFSTFFVALLLLVATGMGPNAMVAEARNCESKSHKFKGKCFSETNCGSVCQTEGFSGGNCRGLRRRCFCTKHC
ncbi:defensin Ec-AMP-D2-like [Argentina anserina]|uniref:defensin Ec-AMP-D2-like n=1 Tax=Argentina anserina TaxID=57926 RepID=UPI0021764CC3|nr:defensin Ec-AMP-D2-like [Potentilla anserina]